MCYLIGILKIPNSTVEQKSRICFSFWILTFLSYDFTDWFTYLNLVFWPLSHFPNKKPWFWGQYASWQTGHYMLGLYMTRLYKPCHHDIFKNLLCLNVIFQTVLLIIVMSFIHLFYLLLSCYLSNCYYCHVIYQTV